MISRALYMGDKITWSKNVPPICSQLFVVCDSLSFSGVLQKIPICCQSAIPSHDPQRGCGSSSSCIGSSTTPPSLLLLLLQVLHASILSDYWHRWWTSNEH